MSSERLVEWQLADWLGLPAGMIFLLCLGMAGVAVAASVYFYRHTLRQITWRQRAIFITLRSAFLLAIIVCLAGPARVEKIYDSNRNSRPLAVLVDRSASMSVPDFHGGTRLTSAVRVFKKIEDDARRVFPSFRYFRFGDSLESASDLDSAVTDGESATDTRLYDSLNQLMKEAPPGGYGGIVCLTDGLDTTDQTPDEFASRALQTHCPLYFATGKGQGTARESLLVREMDVPGQVLRKSQFSARIIVEAHVAESRDVPLSLWMDNRMIAQTSLHLHRGANLVPWVVPVNSGEPGLIHLACHLGDSSEQESIAAVLRVVAQEQVPILFYQGSLDWSFRFIATELQTDPGFSLTGLYAPDLSLSAEVASSIAPSTLARLPDAVGDLQAFKVVVLSNIVASQLSSDQQTALTDYVRGGGGLLFLVSDTEMAATFSSTPLESLMPVIFEASPPDRGGAESVEEFEKKMQDSSSPSLDADAGDFAGDGTNPGVEQLKKYALPANANRSEVADLFGAASGGVLQNLPQFATYAHVRGIKAGGEVLAIHPNDRVDANTPRALLVTQRFGRGHITALLTDGLWRWKLSLPSTTHDPQIFWQQLFRTLAQQEAAHSDLRFSLQPFYASTGQTSSFHLSGVQGTSPPKVSAISPKGVSQPLVVEFDSESNAWSFQFNPTEPGRWCVLAEDDRGAQMETWLRVADSARAKELSGLPADVDGLRRLAESTGGSLLNDGVPPTWSAPRTPDLTILVSKHSEPFWDKWPVLLLCLGLYVTELIWRRRVKLL